MIEPGPRACSFAALIACCALSAPAGAAEVAQAAQGAQAAERRVALAGTMGRQALLSIDGEAPRVMAVGAAAGGVRLLSLGDDAAVVEVDGQRRTLRLGEAAVRFGGGAAVVNGSRITLSSDARGHFVGNGQINGRGVRFMVDTGATVVALGQDEAERIGLAYKNGPRVGLATANGNTVGWRVTLDSVRVGDVEIFTVDAVVQPQPMPFVLMGNSFLARFQMTRENDTMTLLRRY